MSAWVSTARTPDSIAATAHINVGSVHGGARIANTLECSIPGSGEQPARIRPVRSHSPPRPAGRLAQTSVRVVGQLRSSRAIAPLPLARPPLRARRRTHRRDDLRIGPVTRRQEFELSQLRRWIARRHGHRACHGTRHREPGLSQWYAGSFPDGCNSSRHGTPALCRTKTPCIHGARTHIRWIPFSPQVGEPCPIVGVLC